ncbi:MAG TPA: RNA 2'-phosphotransferase [Tepidisphaeraceae bacterium]|nr:RNA 2'-phosphotransferase [Tepidisphaeraceae bacterium]
MSRDTVKISKFLSYVLRHRPDEIGLTLDANGWASISELIERSHKTATPLDDQIIRQVVAESDKKRFAISEDGTRIRASQGHSVEVDLALEPRQPPEILYHGTATRFADEIGETGLKSMGRQHVHLSLDEKTALSVGKRHGKPIILRIRAGEMWKAGTKFYLSDNGVWLTDEVPIAFIDFPK